MKHVSIVIAALAVAAPTTLPEGDTWNFPVHLLSAEPEALARYGGAVALDGDSIVVGAAWDDGMRGSVRVLTFDGTNWIEMAHLSTPDPNTGSFFGASVALRGEILVVGETGYLEGRVHVYRRTAGTWVSSAALRPGEAAYDFGCSVALSGSTIVVGSFDDNGVAPYSGAAFVFAWNGSRWNKEARLRPDGSASDDYFATRVAISGDTAVVGAIGDASFAGAVHVFERSGSLWSPSVTLRAPATAPSANFGVSLACDGDTIVVGATGEDDGAGAVHVFQRSEGAWTPMARLKAYNAEASDRFGTSVAVDGGTILVGASQEDGGGIGVDADGSDNGAPNSGAAYVFVRAAGAWSQQSYLKASDTQANDLLGSAIALQGDLVVVGAPGEDEGGDSSGGAYVFRGDRAPDAPTDLVHFDHRGLPMAVGGVTHLDVTLKATVAHPQQEPLRLQVEVKPTVTPFDGATGVHESSLFLSGTAIAIRVAGLAPGTYHWRARALDQSNTSAWVESAAAFESVNAAPATAPAVQLRGDDGSPLPAGQTVFDSGKVRFQADGDSDPDGDAVRLQIEVRSLGTPFADASTVEGVLSTGGLPATCRAGFPMGAYHWQYRVVDSGGLASIWTAFGRDDAGSADFRVGFAGSQGAGSTCLAAAGGRSGLAALALFLGASFCARKRFRSSR